MPLLLTCVVLFLLGFAAWRDIATRIIPDVVAISIAGLGIAYRLSQGWQALALSLLIASLVFALLLACHARGLVGGADAKLLTALALGLSPLGSYQLMLATALAGGGLAGLYLVLARLIRLQAPRIRKMPRSLVARVARVELWRIRGRHPLPYGVAIAVGAALVLTLQPGV